MRLTGISQLLVSPSPRVYARERFKPGLRRIMVTENVSAEDAGHHTEATIRGIRQMHAAQRRLVLVGAVILALAAAAAGCGGSSSSSASSGSNSSANIPPVDA